jgi:hypothetical protein
MRKLLGMLRADDELLALAPQPSLSGLDALAREVTDAGCRSSSASTESRSSSLRA